MKNLFPQFEAARNVDYKAVWNDALFVFDTNVLLNFYRYQAKTRDELIDILNKVVDRIWIPYHVALEFQRNRLKVIAEQINRFSDVRKIVAKARAGLEDELNQLQLTSRHSAIDPTSLTSGFKNLTEEFLAKLEQLQNAQQQPTEFDPLKERIESLFEGRVGRAPADQASVNELYKEADNRFKAKIPPGFQDAIKDKDEVDTYMHHGIIYQRKYGDLVVWRETLSYAKSINCKSLVFVTDDAKEDWWWSVRANGNKVIGPRPELIEEARVAGIQTFLLYRPENFLRFSMQSLNTQISDEALTEVRDLSDIGGVKPIGWDNLRNVAHHAVYSWLQAQFKEVRVNHIGFPDFVVDKDGYTVGYELRVFQSGRGIAHLSELLYRAFFEISRQRLKQLVIVWVVEKIDDIGRIEEALWQILDEHSSPSLSAVIGVVNEAKVFCPLIDFPFA